MKENIEESFMEEGGDNTINRKTASVDMSLTKQERMFPSKDTRFLSSEKLKLTLVIQQW